MEGNFEEAIEKFKNLIKNDQKNLRLYIDLANCYVEFGKNSEAEQILNDFLVLEPKNLIAKNALGKIKNARN